MELNQSLIVEYMRKDLLRVWGFPGGLGREEVPGAEAGMGRSRDRKDHPIHAPFPPPMGAARPRRSLQVMQQQEQLGRRSPKSALRSHFHANVASIKNREVQRRLRAGIAAE